MVLYDSECLCYSACVLVRVMVLGRHDETKNTYIGHPTKRHTSTFLKFDLIRCDVTDGRDFNKESSTERNPCITAFD